MRFLFCTVSLLAATLALQGCAPAPAPAVAPPLTPPGASASAPGSAAAAPSTPSTPGARAPRPAAECPTVGEAIAPPGPPSAGKARHDEIVAIFQKHREKFRCCYDAARQQTPALKGAYQIEVVLKTDGSIKQISPKKEASEIHDQAMDDCVFTVARALAFSPNADGKETTIPYPFTFTPGGGGK